VTAPTPDGAPIEDYAEALPETAQPTAPEPDEDTGHLLPAEDWQRVVRGAEEDR
jgi:hypothetical protein